MTDPPSLSDRLALQRTRLANERTFPTYVLTTARTFEDLGVSAYNGAGQLLALSPFLNHAGKIVSVEARHAATIRNLLALAVSPLRQGHYLGPGQLRSGPEHCPHHCRRAPHRHRG